MSTKTEPSPLDAFDTAKPNEPIWTVQGGDPLGGPLLRVWAIFARIQAKAIPKQGLEYVFEQLLSAANKSAPRNKKDRKALLVRATETELISWSMDEYLKGHAIEEEEVPVQHFDEFERLDIHDLRRRTAQLISNFFSELSDHCEELQRHGWVTPDLNSKIARTISDLKFLREQFDVKRK